MNRVMMTGRIAFEPELKITPNGIETATVRIAVEDEYAKSGEDKKTNFFDVVCWRQKAVFVCKYFHKGDGIGIAGQLQNRTYKAKDGANRHVTEIIADHIEFGLGKNEKRFESDAGSTPAQAQTYPIPNTGSQQKSINDDLPF